MSLRIVLGMLREEQPAHWLQYRDGSWAPVWSDGRVGECIGVPELLGASLEELAVLVEAGLVGAMVETAARARGNESERPMDSDRPSPTMVSGRDFPEPGAADPVT
ncbi:hypothetical protein [Nocardia carnea]|uniref:hypothetical protein n=1 Tax=Nocardia carnea TaxID=37328 RepID=UPI002453F41D|nr:hypothetical protein [Nocardia carnea]